MNEGRYKLQMRFYNRQDFVSGMTLYSDVFTRYSTGNKRKKQT